MSKQGIEKVAGIFSQMQELRGELLDSGMKLPIDKQDLMLAALLEVMKDSIKEEFAKITLM